MARAAEIFRKLVCKTCRGRGEVVPARVISGVKTVVCPTCKGYGEPKPGTARA